MWRGCAPACRAPSSSLASTAWTIPRASPIGCGRSIGCSSWSRSSSARVSLLQVAVPTRGNIRAYRDLKAELASLVGEINGRHGEVDWIPIRYLNKSFSQLTLAGFYRAAHVGLVTPLQDGMNLVAKEYVAAQNPFDPGVLVLSAFAGAAKQLDAALLVNPHDIEGMARQIASGPGDESRGTPRALARDGRQVAIIVDPELVRRLPARASSHPPRTGAARDPAAGSVAGPARIGGTERAASLGARDAFAVGMPRRHDGTRFQPKIIRSV